MLEAVSSSIAMAVLDEIAMSVRRRRHPRMEAFFMQRA
jgi:hypothetical protein